MALKGVWVSKVGVALLIGLLGLCLGSNAAAQSTTNGAIGGSVRDPQGLGVAQAEVKVRNVGTNQESTTKTDDSGSFRAVGLAPGIYSATVEQGGFAKTTVENIKVEVGRVTEVEIKLTLSSAEASVNVSSEAPLVNTSQQDFATNVDERSISELPINGRRWSTFALLTPGVVPDGNFGLLSFRGISGLLNNNTVDGGDNNQAFFSEERGRTRISYSIAQTSIKEFQVNTSNFSAEYGRAAGGVVNAVTKSGTNDLHGEGFYFIRDNVLGATNPFTVIPQLVNGTTQNVAIKPDDRRHQFGAVVGGPIIRDRLFFLLSYDGQRRNFPGVATTFTPTSLNLSLTDPAVLAARGVTPAQIQAGIAFLTSLTGTVPRTGNQDLYFPKLDWSVNKNNNVTLSYNKLIWRSPAGIQTQASNQLGKSSFGNDYVRGDSLVAHLYSSIGATISNEVRFQYGRDNEYEFTQSPAPGEPTTGPGGSVPDVLVNNVIEFGKPTFLNRKALPDERRLQWADTASMTVGRHLFRFGVDINRVHDISDNLRFESGGYTYSGGGSSGPPPSSPLADFLTDFSKQNGCMVTRNLQVVAAPCYSQYQQAFGPTRFEFTTMDYSVFLQDDWRVRPSFTLNLGVRYEYEQLPKPQLPNPLVRETTSFPSDKNNIGPRLGFAWDVFGNGKTALRGGYGIYYGRVINSTIINAIQNTGLTTGQRQFTIQPTDQGFSGPIYPATLSSPSGTSAKAAVQFFDRNFQAPMIQQTDLVLERQIGWNTAISFAYLLSRGQELPAFLDTNLPAPTSITYTVTSGPFANQSVTLPLFVGARPTASFGSLTRIASVIRSNYNALVIALNRRTRAGLQLQANYTWSHAIDNGQTSTTFTANETALSPLNLQLDKGNSSVNFPHRFVASAVWSPEVSKDYNPVLRGIVNGFSISPIITIGSGYPFVESVSGSPRLVAPGVPQPIASGITGSGAAFTLNRFPLVPRNSDHMPGIRNFDLRISRRFGFTERYKFEVLGEVFNLFNHQQVNGVNQTAYSISGVTYNAAANTFAANLRFNPFNNFAVPNSASNSLYRERQVQLGLRFLF